MKRSDAIAERRYELTTESGETRDVVLRIGKPRRDRAGSWSCPIEVDGFDVHVPSRTFGVDAVQAITLALPMAHVVLRYTDAFREGRLCFKGERDLFLPGQMGGQARLDWLFDDERGYAALLAALLAGSTTFAWTFRRALGSLLGLSIEHRALEVVLRPEVRQTDTLDLLAYPDPETILAIEIDLVVTPETLVDVRRRHHLLRAEEDRLATEQTRPPRRVLTVHVVPEGSEVQQSSHEAQPPDAIVALEWKTLFGILDRTNVLDGDLFEPVLPALSTAAAAAYTNGSARSGQPWSLRFPERERIWQILRQAVTEFHGALEAEAAISWTAWPRRDDTSDWLIASFRRGDTYPRHHRLNVSSKPTRDPSTFDVSIGVADNIPLAENRPPIRRRRPRLAAGAARRRALGGPAPVPGHRPRRRAVLRRRTAPTPDRRGAARVRGCVSRLSV